MKPMSHDYDSAATGSDDPGEGPEASSDDESPADPPPMNRADRRLEAKRAKGRGKPGRTPQQRPDPSDGDMRGQGLRGFARSRRGTNTRRGG